MPPPADQPERPIDCRRSAWNRRRTSRFGISNAECNLGTILDLSATGARIACNNFYKPAVGSRVHLTVTSADGRCVTVPCTVCWIETRGRAREAGLEFTHTSIRDLESLASIATDRQTRDRRAG